MDINNKYTGFEKLIRDKVNNFEYPYDNKEWIEFRKKLPKSPKSFTSPNNLFRYFVISAAVIIPALTIIYFVNVNNHDKQENINKTTKDQTTININNKQDNSQTTNNNLNNADQISNKGSYTGSEIKNSTKNQSKETIDNNKEGATQKNVSDKNPLNNNQSNKGNNTVSNPNENKNTPNFIELIYADVIEGCAPLNVQFKPLISSDTISYLWAFGDYKTSTKQAPLHVYSKSGTYTVTLTVKFAKSQQTKKITYSKNINVYSKPEAKFEYTASDDGYDYTFTDASADAIYWFWNFSDKSSSKDKNPQHTYKHNGIYNVQLIVFNASGCSDTITKAITVKFKPPFWINNGFKPDGVTTTFGPSGENMNPDGYKMSIYDNSGKLVFETSDLETKWDGKISGTNTDAKTGVYYYKISMKDKYGNMQEWPGFVTLLW